MSVFVDTNVAIYATGSDHPNKQPSLDVLDLIADYPASFVTDAEVLQEILHRYLAIHAWARGEGVLHRFTGVMLGRISPILPDDVLAAASFAGQHPRLQARDLIHLAVMRRLGVTRIVSADRAFDGVPDVARLDPARLDEWRATVAQ